ncbi:chemotaxis protein CheY, partial [Luteibacter yeojuensis]
VWGLRQGAKDYVVKPIKEEELVKALQAHLPG